MCPLREIWLPCFGPLMKFSTSGDDVKAQSSSRHACVRRRARRVRVKLSTAVDGVGALDAQTRARAGLYKSLGRARRHFVACTAACSMLQAKK